MNRHVVAVCCFVATIILGASLAHSQTTAPKPGPEQKRLEVFAGNWTYEGEIKAGPWGPAGKLTSKDRNELVGGFYIERHFEEKGPAGERKGIHTFGYDPVKKTYVQSGFSSDGGSWTGTVSVTGNNWTFMSTGQAAGKPIQSRCAVAFAAGNASFTMNCEASSDSGKTWMPTSEGKATKSRASSN